MESKLEFSDTLTPRTNWLRIAVAIAVSLAVAGLLAVAGMVLSGCSEPGPPRIERQNDISSIPGLEGCVLLNVSLPCRDDDPETTCRYRLQIVRCPNSATSTTYRVGKREETILTVDGGAAP